MMCHIKKSQFLSKIVENSPSFKMMIVTLVPFILAARLNFSESHWKEGEKGQVTYLIQDQATKKYLGGSDGTDEIFNLKALLTCQHSETGLLCYFHNVDVYTRYANSTAGPGFIQSDIWLKKILHQGSFVTDNGDDGHFVVWLPVEVEQTGRNIIGAFVYPLNIGLNFSSQFTGNYETKLNLAQTKCRIRNIVTRTSDLNEKKNSSMELFLIARPDEELIKPIEIVKRVDDDKCTELHYFFSPFTIRELRKINDKLDVDIKTATTDSFIKITANNFTSLTKNVISVHNRMENKKYIINETLSLTLQKIEKVNCNEMVTPDDCTRG